MNFYNDLLGIAPVLIVSLAGLIVVILEALFKKGETISYFLSIISLNFVVFSSFRCFCDGI